MKTFSIKASLKAGWSLWKHHRKLLVLSTLIIVIFNFLSDVEGEGSWILNIHGIVFGIIAMLLQIGWTKLLFKVNDGKETNLHELVQHFSLFWKYLGTTILFCLGSFLGLLLLVVPGVYFILTYQFVFLLIVDRHMGVKAAFEESARITKGAKWKLLGFTVVSLLVNLAGFIALGVGILVSIPVTMLAYIHIFRLLEGKASEAHPATS